MKLTKPAIDALVCPAGKKDMLVFDDELRGFGVRVTAAGAKLFVFQYSLGGRKERITLGRYGEMTPHQARLRAEEHRGKVNAGDSPLRMRRAKLHADRAAEAERKRAAESESFTFAKLADEWCSDLLAKRRPRYRDEARRALATNFAELVRLPAAAIDRATARKAIAAIEKERGASMAFNSLAYARAAYNWAIGQDKLASNPFLGIKLAARPVSRERVLSDAEIAEIWNAAAVMAWPMGIFVQFLMLTLQREAETAALRWRDLADDWSTWTIPGARAKNGKAHIVPLPEPARALLRIAWDHNMHRRRQSEFAFTTTGTTPVSGFSNAKERLDKLIMKARQEAGDRPGAAAASAPQWRFQDFRRTGVSVLPGLGVPAEVADKLLNHIQGKIRGVAAIYQRYEFMPERTKAAELWAAHVLRLASAAAPAARQSEPARTTPANFAPHRGRRISPPEK